MDNQSPVNYSGTKGTRLARRSSFSKKEEPYACKHPWPHDCFVQCGGDGVVLPRETIKPVLVEGKLDPIAEAMAGTLQGSYRTAFFEAFPKFPAVFIRGEGPSIDDAEADCWKKFVKMMSCQKHEFVGKIGCLRCKHCGMDGPD